MPEDALPANLHEFITQHVRSLEQLEILLLVARDRTTPWTVQTVYDVILSTKPSVERWLDEFTRLGFLQKEPTQMSEYRFAGTDETGGLIRELGQLYKTKPVRVIEAIFKADQNPAQSFADAFRLKRKE